LDAADTRRLRRRPEPVRAAVHDDRRGARGDGGPLRRLRARGRVRARAGARSRMSFRALIVEHERATPAGLVYDWLADRGAEVDELRIDVEDRDVDVRDFDLIVPLGSEFAAYDDAIPWIPREMRL